MRSGNDGYLDKTRIDNKMSSCILNVNYVPLNFAHFFELHAIMLLQMRCNFIFLCNYLLENINE